MQQAQQQDFIYLTSQTTLPNDIQYAFHKVRKLAPIVLQQFGHEFGRIQVFYLSAFRGFQ